MDIDLFPGVSFWLNWVFAALLVGAIIALAVSYRGMARRAPALKRGERSDEHVLHDYRNATAFIVVLDGAALFGVLYVGVAASGGWIVLGAVLSCAVFSFLTSWYFQEVTFEESP